MFWSHDRLSIVRLTIISSQVRPMPELTYPFDPTGRAQTNLVVDEQHVVTELNFRHYYFIVPHFAPFYAHDVVVKHLADQEVRTLVEGVDYALALTYVGATRSIGQPIYGAITLNSLINIGLISISYRSLGGVWTADRHYIIEQLAERVYNPRLTIWDNLTNVTSCFPPINHYQDASTLHGQEELVESILTVSNSIAEHSGSAPVVRHLVHYDNPHRVTLEQLGYRPATGDDALDPTIDDAFVTPESLAPVFNWVRQEVNNVTIQVTDYSVQFTHHLLDYTNPHRVTKQQVGLGLVENIPLAHDSEVSNKDSVDKLVTLRQLLNLLNSSDFGKDPSHNQYNIVPASTVVVEGDGVLMHVSTVEIPDYTVLYWSVTHLTTNDQDFYQTSGTVTLLNNSARFVITTRPDILAEDSELFSVRLRKQSPTGPIVAVSQTIMLVDSPIDNHFTITTTPNILDKGQSTHVTISATAIPDGSRIYWTIAPLSVPIASFVSTEGSIVFTDRQASFTVTIRSDASIRSRMFFKIQLRLDSISSSIIDESGLITVRRRFSTLESMLADSIFDPRIEVTPESLFVNYSLKPMMKTRSIVSRRLPAFTLPFDMSRVFRAATWADPRLHRDAGTYFGWYSLHPNFSTRLTRSPLLPWAPPTYEALTALTTCHLYDPRLELSAANLFMSRSIHPLLTTRMI